MTKRWLVKLHLWLGLSIGLLWALQGLTGSALVFYREIDRLANPLRVGSAGPMLPPSVLIRAAEAQADGKVTVLRVMYRQRDIFGADYIGSDGKKRTLFLDGATGKIVDVRFDAPLKPIPGSTSRFVYNVHVKLLSGKTGDILVATSGALLLSSVLFGLWIAWPKRRGWRQVAALKRWRSTPQKLFGWHRLGGLAAGLVLMTAATTGIYLAFDEPLRAAIGHPSYFKSEPRSELLTTVSADTALRTALNRFPGAEFVRLTLPTNTAPFYNVRLLQTGELRAFLGRTMVIIDPESGEVVRSYDAVRASLPERIVDLLFVLHNGEIAGLAGRFVVFVAGLMLPVLYTTGVWLWLIKRRQRAKRASLPKRVP